MHLSVVRKYTVEHLKRQIPAPALPLNILQEPDALDVMKKGTHAVALATLGEEPLSIVSKGCMADVMAQSNGFDQVQVQSKQMSNGPRHFGYELHVEHPVGDVIILDEVENLGFVDIAGIGQRVEYPVGIHGKSLPVTPVNRFFFPFSDGLPTQACMGR
jgi:hypothetical protein